MMSKGDESFVGNNYTTNNLDYIDGPSGSSNEVSNALKQQQQNWFSVCACCVGIWGSRGGASGFDDDLEYMDSPYEDF